jgi:1-acyl-sn-glycerol-3-phosphate acyltransferase
MFMFASAKMIFLTRLLRTLFGVYALILFLLSFLITFPCYFFIFTFFPAERAPRIAHKYISRAWAKTLFPIFGIRVRVKNKELLDKSATYVFIANHRSQLDIPAYAVATDHTFRFLAKAELTKLPLMGYIIKKLYISVDRKSKKGRAESMERMIGSIREGISVFICPEGTRNKTDQPLIDFRDGAFRLAVSAQIPIAPMVILNSGKLLSPLRPIELSPGTLTCVWLKPYDTTGLTQDDIPVLKATIIGEMKRILRMNE